MRIIVAETRQEAEDYCHKNGHRFYPLKNADTVIASSPRALEGVRPTEIHLLSGHSFRRDIVEILETLDRAGAKMPQAPEWKWPE